MARNITATRTVASFEAFGRELLWEGSEFSTGVMLVFVLDGTNLTRVVRPGKGDYLEVDMAAVLDGMTPVYLSGNRHEPVALLGKPVDGPVQVTGPDYFGEWDGEWTEFPNYETALVELTLLHCS